MVETLNLLLIEDMEDDAWLVLRELGRGGFSVQWERVETLEDLKNALQQKPWDLVISDYRLPHLNAPIALKVVREYQGEVPFILISGTIGEVLAVEMMRDGAHDYVMKDNLQRLPEAVRRELRDAQVRIDHQQAEQRLKESEQRFRHLFESTPLIAVQGYNPQRQVIYWNKASERIYGYTKAEALGRQLEDLVIPPEMRQFFIDAVHNWQTLGQEIPAAELSLQHRDGSRVTVFSSHVMLINSQDEQELYCVDIDLSDRQAALRERQQAEMELRESEARYRLLAENTNDLVCLLEPDGRCTYASPSCEMLLGYQYSELVGQDLHTLIHPDDVDRVAHECNISLENQYSVPLVTYRIRHKSGHYLWFETLAKPIRDAKNQVIKLLTTSRDVTERIEAQQQLQYDALHDSLTGLPNRNLLIDRLELAINRSRRLDGYYYAVLFLDLDRFKVINDSLGHLAGDQLLTLVAQKLKNHIRDIDLVARLGGDEFVILLEDVIGVTRAVQVTERILADLQNPILIDDSEVVISTSVGIVLGTENYQQASDLIRDADIAMYRAKAAGRSSYKVFDVEMHTQAVHRLTLETDLRKALEREEFFVCYQPIMAIANNNRTSLYPRENLIPKNFLVGFEALARWQHPTRGVVSPEEFIAMAEETGLIVPIDRWIFTRVCQQLAEWKHQLPNCYPKMSINLSVQDLRQSNLLESIDRVLAATGIAGSDITLEITESMLIENINKTIELLKQLKERHIQISIDDFGTGYSSLNYLHRLPADNLKIDRSFVGQMHQGNRNYQVVSTIIALSNQLGLAVVAEGIETPQQLQWLQDMGCEFGQGYFFSQPLSAAMTEAMLRG